MPTKKQITVPIANQPGTLTLVAGLLASKGFVMEAMTVFEGGVHFTTPDLEGAVAALQEKGFACIQNDVLVVDAGSSLARATGLLAGAGINIDYAYSSGGGGYIMLVSDLKRAEDLLGSP